MLPAQHRMRRSADIALTVRRGRRTGRPTLVLHSLMTPTPDVLVGFAVARSVGTAVMRNRVKRRLRHLVAPRLATAPAGLRLVVRALPAAARAGQQLDRDLEAAWARAARGWGTTGERGATEAGS